MKLPLRKPTQENTQQEQPEPKKKLPFGGKKKKQTKESLLELSDEELEKRISQQKQKDTQQPNAERYYVTNGELMEELLKWRDSNKEEEERRLDEGLEIDYTDRVISDKLARMMMEVARKISNHSFFRNYTQETKEDMQSYAIEKMIGGLKNYNFKYTNAFAYLSQACFNAFKTHLSKYYKQMNIKRDLTKKAIIELDTFLPNSSMSKCLNKQFTGNDFDDFSEY